MDAAGLTAGLAVPIVTFAGLWLWRFGPRRREDRYQVAPRTEAELTQSVMRVHARLADLQRQMTELGQDWEERDRQLAERISGLIEIARAADGGERGGKDAAAAGAGDQKPGDKKQSGGA